MDEVDEDHLEQNIIDNSAGFHDVVGRVAWFSVGCWGMLRGIGFGVISPGAAGVVGQWNT